MDRLPDAGPAADLGLGRRTSAAAARRTTGLPAPAIRALGAADAVYATPAGRFGPAQVSVVYVARRGLPATTSGLFIV